MAKKKKAEFRVTDAEYNAIMRVVETKGISKTDVLRDCLNSLTSSVTPAKLVKLQNLVNDCCAEMEKTNPEKSAVLRKEMNDLWQ